MLESGVIIRGGKQRSDINAMYVTEPSPHQVQLWLHVRASVAFSKGALRLIALGLVARSAGPTFWKGCHLVTVQRVHFSTIPLQIT